MAPRRVFLGLLALVLMIAASSGLAQAQDSTTNVTNTTNTTVGVSFCELCRDKGNCAQAYKGAPGIFCGAWLNAANQRMACCCPANGQCAKTPSNYECKCRGKSTPKPKNKHASHKSSSRTWIWIILSVFIVVLIGVGLYFYCQRSDYGDEGTTTTYVQQPVVMQAPPPAPVYASQPMYGKQPMYGQPSYGSQQYQETPRKGYGAGTAAAGGAAGFLGGVIVGDLVSDAGSRHQNNHSQSGVGGGDVMFAGDI